MTTEEALVKILCNSTTGILWNNCIEFQNLNSLTFSEISDPFPGVLIHCRTGDGRFPLAKLPFRNPESDRKFVSEKEVEEFSRKHLLNHKECRIAQSFYSLNVSRLKE